MKRMLLASASCLALAGCGTTSTVTPPPPPPTITINPNPSGGMLTLTFPAALPSFYGPSLIKDGSAFKMWTTNADRIARYLSVDGRNFTDEKIVMQAIPGSWEDDGLRLGSIVGGVSNPCVMFGITPGYAYTMLYTGGSAPNTATSGGIGCAVSNDGDNWSRVGSGLLRSFPGGNCFMQSFITIRGKRYAYFTGGAPTPHQDLLVMDDTGDGIHFANDRVVPGLPESSVPLFYDDVADCVWTAVDSTASTDAGPASFDIYKGGDGFTTLGEKVCTIGSAQTGKKANFQPQALRTSQGLRVPGPVQIIFSAGDTWGNWQPASIII